MRHTEAERRRRAQRKTNLGSRARRAIRRGGRSFGGLGRCIPVGRSSGRFRRRRCSGSWAVRNGGSRVIRLGVRRLCSAAAAAALVRLERRLDLLQLLREQRDSAAASSTIKSGDGQIRRLTVACASRGHCVAVRCCAPGPRSWPPARLALQRTTMSVTRVWHMTPQNEPALASVSDWVRFDNLHIGHQRVSAHMHASEQATRE